MNAKLIWAIVFAIVLAVLTSVYFGNRRPAPQNIPVQERIGSEAVVRPSAPGIDLDRKPTGLLVTNAPEVIASSPPMPTPIASNATEPAHTKISAFRKYMTEQPQKRMTLEVFKSVGPKDVDWLLASMRSEPDLTKRRLAVLGLAASGDPRAFEAIRHMVLAEFAGQDLNNREVHAMAAHVRALGILSRKNPAAVDFLITYSKPSAWKQGGTRMWNSVDRSEDETSILLAGSAIKGLGESDRPEARTALMAIGQWPAAELSHVSGAVVDAMFTQSYIARHGIDGWEALALSGGAVQRQLEWYGTDEGRKWMGWGLAVDQLAQEPPPAPK